MSDLELPTVDEARGLILRWLRLLTRAPQGETAERADISASYLRAIEGGRQSSIDVQTRLASLFGIDPRRLDTAPVALLSLQQESGRPFEPKGATNLNTAKQMPEVQTLVEHLLPGATWEDFFHHVTSAWEGSQEPAEMDPRARAVSAQLGTELEPDEVRALSELLSELSQSGRLRPGALQRMRDVSPAEPEGPPSELPVTAIPPHTVWFLHPQDLRRSANGEWWLDPLATAEASGNPGGDVRVLRRTDGRVVIDISHADSSVHAAQAPDPWRHALRVVTAELPAYVPTEAYAATRLEFETEGGALTVDLADDADRSRSPRDVGLDADHVLIVTAYNPGSSQVPTRVNASADAALKAELDARGLRAIRATGSPSNPEANPWGAEPGWAVLGAPEQQSELIELAHEFGQNSVFVWTTDGWNLIMTAVPDDPLGVG